MPEQRPGRSRQDYQTPRAFLDALERRYGAMTFDLACDGIVNAKAPRFFTKVEDALSRDWRQLAGNLWLNPEYADIAPWARKCAASATPGNRVRKIFLLTPASVGSEWFAEHVEGKALVEPLRPRLSFDGKAPYPKDLLLATYGVAPGFKTWRWKP